jgi:hypothetical protein
MSPTEGATCHLYISTCHPPWHIIACFIWQVEYSGPTCPCLCVEYTTTCKGGPFGSLRLQNCIGLECSVVDKPKGPKVRAMWRDFGLFQEFKTPKDMHVERKRGVQCQTLNSPLSYVLTEDQVSSLDWTVDGLPPWM